MREVSCVIIGGGSAGMAAACSAWDHQEHSILILERGSETGGILNQCIHNGFGLQVFQKEMTGPGFSERLTEEVSKRGIEVQCNTEVLSVSEDKVITAVSERGIEQIQARTIIFACGCYERSAGMIHLPGKRLKGIYTAGLAQKYLNVHNILVGKRVVILGSGDIGLIMARRMTLEGAKVLCVAELMPYSNGLNRNIVQCLDDFDIPLYCSHTVVNVEGDTHVQRITIAAVDENRQPVKGTEKVFDADTLLLSVGLIPENDLAMQVGIELDPRTKGAVVDETCQTSVDGIYACGNALHVHDLVDFVTIEAAETGRYAAAHEARKEGYIEIRPSDHVGYVVPQRLYDKNVKDLVLSFRVRKPIKRCEIVLVSENEEIYRARRPFLIPSEMVRLKIRKSVIEKIGNDLEVKVVEE